MPDTATVVAATLAIKKGTEYLDAFLKPALKTAGKELSVFVKEKISDWKAEKKAKNLRGHMTKAQERIEERKKYSGDLPSAELKTIQSAEVFEAWMAGAEEVDPDDNVLGPIWQGLLVAIASGNHIERELVDALRSLTPFEAELLLRLSGGSQLGFSVSNRRSRDKVMLLMPERFDLSEDGRDALVHRLRSLSEKHLISRRYTWEVLTAVVVGAMLIAAQPVVDRYILGGLPSGMIYATTILAGICLWATVRVMAPTMSRWSPTWLGRALLAHVPRSATRTEHRSAAAERAMDTETAPPTKATDKPVEARPPEAS